MGTNYFVIFDILGIKNKGASSSFAFEKDAECVVNNDRFISKVVISADISRATFYLHDSLEIEEKLVPQIVEYLTSYLGKMMISLLKNSLQYSSVLLKPTIRLSEVHLLDSLGIDNIMLNDCIQIHDSVISRAVFENGNEIVKKWVQDVEVSDYTSKQDKYDILFLLLQGENIVQKYMAMYAYLMSLVREINSKPRETQKQVVDYVSNNCSRVGIILHTSQSTRPEAKTNEQEDQFTALRNKIGHPSVRDEYVVMSENAVNELASIICCAIEDIPL